MELYRICLEKYSNDLRASGYPSRWNSSGRHVIYTASSRSLACLENVVHRSGEGLNNKFKVLVIYVPDSLIVENVDVTRLPEDWHTIEGYSACQPIGDEWYESQISPILKVPSSIITLEHNYILSTLHPHFSQIKIVEVEDFGFDSRIKDEPS